MYLQRVPSFIQNFFPAIQWSAISDPRLHLTFDDGPHPDSTPQLLDVLDSLKLKTTFFCLGHRLKADPHLGEEIIARGHQLGNHGYDHISGWTSSQKKYMENVRAGAELSNSKLYRPPYGRILPQQYKAVSKNNAVLFWTRMPGDFDPSVNKEALADRLRNCSENDIIVLHDKPACVDKVIHALLVCYSATS